MPKTKKPRGEGVPAHNTLFTCVSKDRYPVVRYAADASVLDSRSTYSRVQLKGLALFEREDASSPGLYVSCRSPQRSKNALCRDIWPDYIEDVDTELFNLLFATKGSKP